MVFPCITLTAAAAISESFPRITGDLPPNSKVRGTRFSEAAFITCFAIAVPPVKSIWSKGKLLNAAPTSASPVKTAISTSSKYSSNIVFITSEVAGVISEGFTITLFPAAKIPPIGANTKLTGKFQGLIHPTVPLG